MNSGLPWWPSGKESAASARDVGSALIREGPRAAEPLDVWATGVGPVALEPGSCISWARMLQELEATLPRTRALWREEEKPANLN